MSIWAELADGITTASATETQAIAARIAAALPAEATLALSGDLGAGKTTFVQGLAAAFGVREHVTSPTFTLYNVHRGDRTLVHLDAYRLENPTQVDGLLLEDFLVRPYCLVVEWPERIAGWLPPETVTLQLAIVSPGRHRLVLRGAAPAA